MLSRKRMVHKFFSNKKRIVVIFYFDKKGKDYYQKLGPKEKAVIDFNIKAVNKIICSVIDLNSDVVGESRLKIEIKITEFVVPTNMARTESKTKPGEMYLALGAVFLTNSLDAKQLINYFIRLIRHEFAHTQDVVIKDGYKEYGEVFLKHLDDLLPFNLLISIDFMRQEGFSEWTSDFHDFHSATHLGKDFSALKELFHEKIHSIKTSEEPYTAYRLVGTLPYSMGFHVFVILTLDFLRKHGKLNDFRLVDYGHNEYPVSMLFSKLDDGLFLYPSLNRRDFRQLYTYFKRLNRFMFIEKYLIGFNNLGYDKKHFIFTDQEIESFLALKKEIK